MLRTSNHQSKRYALLLAIIGIFCFMTITACGTKTVDLDADFQKILTYKFGDSREPLSVIQDRIRSSHGDQQERLNLERQLAQLLRSESSHDCKDFAFRQLRVIGTNESVKELSKWLVDDKYSDLARYALELNTDLSACKAFRKALGKAQGKTLVGIINSIGERRDEDSVKALEKLATGDDKDVAAAAVDALRKIAG